MNDFIGMPNKFAFLLNSMSVNAIFLNKNGNPKIGVLPKPSIFLYRPSTVQILYVYRPMTTKISYLAFSTSTLGLHTSVHWDTSLVTDS